MSDALAKQQQALADLNDLYDRFDPIEQQDAFDRLRAFIESVPDPGELERLRRELADYREEVGDLTRQLDKALAAGDRPAEPRPGDCTTLTTRLECDDPACPVHGAAP